MKRIFIGGMGRSGTTIAVNIFYNHPDCFAVPIETKFLVEEDGFADLVDSMTTRFSPPSAVSAFQRFENQMRNEVTGLSPSKYSDLHQYAPDIFPSYHDALDRFIGVILNRRYYPERATLIAAVRSFARELFDYTAVISDKKCWVEKTPANIWRLDFLREVYPDCYFLHMIRHPLEIYYSLREKGWLPDNLVASMVIFEGYCNALARQRRRWLNDPNFVELKLEQLVQYPGISMQDLVRQMGLSDIPEAGMAAVVKSMEKYYANKETTISRDLPDHERDLVIEMLQPWVIEFGYGGMR